MSVNITEHLSITRSYGRPGYPDDYADTLEVLVMVEGSEFVHKADIKVSDWPDYLYYGYNGRRNAQNKQGRYRSTLEYVRLQDWTWTATDKKHPSTYRTDD